MNTKKCKTCKTEKNLSEFYNASKTKDGKKGRCITCTKIYRHQYYVSGPQQKRVIPSSPFQSSSLFDDIWQLFFAMGKDLFKIQVISIRDRLAALPTKEVISELDRIIVEQGLKAEDFQSSILEELRIEKRLSSQMNIRLGRLPKRKVQALDMNLNVVATYDSLRDASIALTGGIATVGSISNCCQGKTLTSCGFIWQYLDKNEK